MADVTSRFLSATMDRYRIEDRIGSGGMARVYKGWDTNLDRPVAIKILHEHLADDPTFKERFEREAKLVASLNHPNLVQVYDFNFISERGNMLYYMVMPYLPGPTLEAILETQRQQEECLNDARVLQITRNIADGLDYAHGRGMVHRDVKPSNILFDEHDQAVLTDFGIARLAESSNLTQEGITLGTPAYMSPEQVTGARIDHRTDIYSLGVILFEMITGHAPFADEGSVSVLLQHLNTPVPAASEICDIEHLYVDSVIYRAMAKRAEDRYQTAGDLADDLEAAYSGQEVAVPPIATLTLPITGTGTVPALQQTPVQPAPPQPKQRSPLVIFALGMVVITFMLVVALISRSSMSSPPTPTPMPQDSGVDSMAGELYFTTTFAADDPTISYWPIGQDGDVVRAITLDNHYRFFSDLPSRALTTIIESAYQYAQASITLNATLEDISAPASGYGIVFRYVDDDHFNVFAVDGLGRYSIWLRENGQWEELRHGDERWTPDDAIQPMGSLNTLSVDVTEHSLMGYVNGQLVVTVEDDTVQEGSVGVYLATTPSGSASVLIDSFSVHELDTEIESMTGG